MAISYVGSAAAIAGGGANSTVNNATATLPSGLASGDLLLLFVDRTNDFALTSGTPAGYSFLRNILDVNTTPSAAQTDIYYKICTGSETTTGPNFTASSQTRWIIHAAAYRGVNTTTPFIVQNGQGEAGTSATHAAPAITNTNASAWAVFHALTRGSATPQSWTPPTGFTERLDTDAAVAGTTNLYAITADSNAVVATGANTYSATATSSASAATAWAAYLNPIAAAPAVPTGGVAVAVTPTQINTSWTAVPGALTYDLEMDGVVIATDIAATEYAVTGLAPATEYDFRVRANG